MAQQSLWRASGLHADPLVEERLRAQGLLWRPVDRRGCAYDLDSGANHIRMLYPSEGSYLVPEGMFLVKGSANQPAARTLYDLLLGKPVQQTLLEQENRRPARTDIALTQYSTLPELSSLRIAELPAPQGEQTPAHSLAVWHKAVAAAR